MSEWNAMTYEGKDTILRVVRREAEQMFAMADPPQAWDAPTACEGWATRDVIAHIVDTTEGYFRAFDAASGQGSVPDPHGLAVMAEKIDEVTTSMRGIPQAEMMGRIRADLEKMMGILEPLTAEQWTGHMVTHPFMGPVPAFFYAAGQLMDYGVHSWDIRQGAGGMHALAGDVADLLVPFMFAVLQGTVRTEAVTEPISVGVRITGENGGDYRVTVSSAGMTYEQGDVADLPAVIEFDAGSFVLRAFGRTNSGTVRGDMATAEKFLNLFFKI